MSRRLIRSVALALLCTSAVAASSEGPAGNLPGVPALQRFLSQAEEAPVSYRALRRLEARGDSANRTAWMEVWTEADAAGFRYAVVGAGGSGFVRSKVFLAALDTEKKMHNSPELARAALTPENYVFEEAAAAGALAAVGVRPKRKDKLLVDGSIFLRPEDGDLVRVEGRLAKAPSFWIRRVDIVRTYERIGGSRLPVSTEAVASVRFAGQATFQMTYEYETVNGERVGSPQVATAAPLQP